MHNTRTLFEQSETYVDKQLKSLFEPQGRAQILIETEVSSRLSCLIRLYFNLHSLCDASDLFHHRPLSAPEGPVADRGAPREGSQ